LKTLAAGLELRHPDPKMIEDLDSRGASKASRNPEVFAHFESLLEVSP
jgi:hypothetical protein